MNLSIRNRHCSIAFMSSYFFWRELLFDWRASICFWRLSTMLSLSQATSSIDFSFKVEGHNSRLLYSVTSSSHELFCRMLSCITRVLLDLWYVLAANIVFPPGKWAEHTLWLKPGLHKPFFFSRCCLSVSCEKKALGSFGCKFCTVLHNNLFLHDTQ